MALSVQTNLGANTALKNINMNSANQNKSLERLSSGFRINNAADDAAGFAVSSKLDAQSSRLKAASLNASQAQAMTKMADAGVNEIQNMVGRIQTLATQASSANNAGELGKLDAERIKLESAIDKIANGTNYNGVNLLNGTASSSATPPAGVTAITGSGAAGGAATTGLDFTSTAFVAGTPGSITGMSMTDSSGNVFTQDAASVAINSGTGSTVVSMTGANGGTMSVAVDNTAASRAAGTPSAVTLATQAMDFQVGADNTVDNQVSISLNNSYTTAALGLGTGDLTTQAGAQAYIDTSKAAMNTLITQRADLGATQNQVSFIQANLATSIEQTTASVSTIRDADMATEMADFTKNKILTQAATSMLAQANQAAQNVLSLFR